MLRSKSKNKLNVTNEKRKKVISPLISNSPLKSENYDIYIDCSIKNQNYKIYCGQGFQKFIWLSNAVLHFFEPNFGLSTGNFIYLKHT